MGRMEGTLEKDSPMTHPQQADHAYLALLREVLTQGERRGDRTGTGTLSLFGPQASYDLTGAFPLLTTKKIYTRGIFAELLFFLQGQTNNEWLRKERVTIWDEWAAEDGDLGPIYGYQWRHFAAPYDPGHTLRDFTAVGGTDQIMEVLKGLREDPFGRRHIVSAWNPNALGEMALPPCHSFFQFYVTADPETGKPTHLSCKLTQRSADLFLGVPWNIACYSALTQLFAGLLGLKPLRFIHSLGDAHIYLNHLEQVEEQLSREGSLSQLPPAAGPTLTIKPPAGASSLASLDSSDPLLFHKFSVEDFVVEGYHPLPPIRAAVSI